MPVPWVWNIQFIWQLLLVFKFSLFSKGKKTLQQCKVKCGICQEGWRGGWGVRGVKGIICAATVWPQWSVCGQLATPKPWREGCCSLRLVKPLASHRKNPSYILTAADSGPAFVSMWWRVTTELWTMGFSKGLQNRLRCCSHPLALPALHLSNCGPTKAAQH